MLLSLGSICCVIIWVIVGTSYTKLHPFWVLFSAALLMAFLLGLDVLITTQYVVVGFWKALKSVGLLILFGTFIGAALELSSGAISLAKGVLKLLHRLPLPYAISFIGYLVSIPVFCDAAFVILSQLNKTISKQTKVSLKGLTVALSTGLFAPHVLIPPTPGPLVAAANLEVDNLFLLILVGSVLAFILVIVGGVYGHYIIKKDRPEIYTTPLNFAQDFTQKESPTPNFYRALTPILVPIVLMTLGAIVPHIGEETLMTKVVDFVTMPVTALAVGALLSLRLNTTRHGWFFLRVLKKGVLQAFPIVMITCMGGALATVIQTIPLEDYVLHISTFTGLGILIPFAIAALLKTAQGSSTIAIITTSSIILPLLPLLNLDSEMGKVWAIMALGVGSMTVSHANDSYFWVVAQMSGMNVKEAYRTHTVGTLLQGVVGLILVYLGHSLWSAYYV